MSDTIRLCRPRNAWCGRVSGESVAAGGASSPVSALKPWQRAVVVTLLGLLLGPAWAMALDPTRGLSQYNCQTWTRQNGLPTNGVNGITQTADGYLWLATQRGLVRFDGVKFTIVSLPDGPPFRGQVVKTLSRSESGGIWFGINDGTLAYHSADQGFVIPRDNPWQDPNTIVITVTEVRDGAVWVGLEGGVARYRRDNPGATIFDDRFKAARGIVDDPSGRVWLISEAGIHYWQDGSFFPLPDESLKNELLINLAVDHDRRLWVGTTNGLRCYDADLQRVELPAFEHAVRSMLVDRQGVLWVGLADGVARYHNGQFSFLLQGEGLAPNLVLSLYEDREGSLWVGTLGGLSQLSDVKFPIYATTEGLIGGTGMGVSTSATGGVWYAASMGLSLFHDGKSTNYSTEAGLSSRYIKRVFEASNGDVYVLNGSMGVEILSHGEVVASVKNPNWPTALVEDREGMIVSVGGQIFRVSRAGLAPFIFRDGQDPALPWIRNLFVSKDGALWVASVRGVRRVEDGAVQSWTSADGLSGDDVYHIGEDGDGVIWVALDTGMARIKDGKVSNITRADGLLDDALHAIVADDFGYIWVNSSRGIFRVARQQLNDFAHGKITRVESEAFNGLNAMKTSDVTAVEFIGCKTQDGRIWFPTPIGLVAIDPANIPHNAVAPLVRIEKARANSRDLPRLASLRVSPGPGELEVHFTALSFIAPQSLRFRYRLEGYDDSWVEVADRRLAFYTNLPPGRYRFHVTAANADGVWSPEGDALELELLPHFYQTVWFYLLSGGLCLGVVTGAYLRRIHRMRMKERALQENRIMLENEVRNRTADLQKENAERKRAEVELAKSLSVLHATLESTVDGILVLDRAGRLTACNRPFLEMWHIPREAIETGGDERTLAPVIEQLKDPTAFTQKARELNARPEASSFDILELKDGRIIERYSQPQRVGEDIVGRVWCFRDISDRKRAEAELAATHRNLLEVSRQAGMAEIATGVLHNVGNVLNSVNVSATLVADHVRTSKGASIGKLAALFEQHQGHLATFLTQDPRGQMIPGFLRTLAGSLTGEHQAILQEVERLRKNIDHIKDIVSMQQSYARNSGLVETLPLLDLIEDALRINAGSLARHDVQTLRDYQSSPVVTTDKHKVIQILVNLVRNAKHACDDSGSSEKKIVVRTTSDEHRAKIAIIDNGVGIPAENLSRIFNHGFTTRAHGHGFGLHSGALAARELGGTLQAQSAGPGLGATFTLELPINGSGKPSRN
jgi:ligand-binding sensor domain-containing protein/signal transduction histidine kinase